MNGRFVFLKFLIIAAVISLLGSCKKPNDPTDSGDDPVMIRYRDHELKRSDLSEQAQQSLTPKDSIQLINNFIEKWLKDQIMIKEAKSQLSNQEEMH